MTQLKNFLDRQTERKFPSNPEEESRKNRFPQTCSESCPHHQCSYHNTDHYGLPCEQQWKPKLNENMTPQSKPNPNQQLLRGTFEERLAKAIHKAMEPSLKRLERLEAETQKPITRSFFNGSKILYRIDQNMNQKNFNYD